MVGRGRGRAPGTGLVLAAAVEAPWLGYCVPEAQKEANGEGNGGALEHRRGVGRCGVIVGGGSVGVGRVDTRVEITPVRSTRRGVRGWCGRGRPLGRRHGSARGGIPEVDVAVVFGERVRSFEPRLAVKAEQAHGWTARGSRRVWCGWFGIGLLVFISHG